MLVEKQLQNGGGTLLSPRLQVPLPHDIDFYPDNTCYLSHFATDRECSHLLLVLTSYNLSVQLEVYKNFQHFLLKLELILYRPKAELLRGMLCRLRK